MKKQQLQTTVDLNYNDEKLLAYIEARHQEYQTQAIQLGKQHGHKDAPQKDESLNSYREPIYRNYNLLVSEAHSKLEAGVQLQFGSMDITETKTENHLLEVKLEGPKGKLKAMNTRESLFPYILLTKLMGALLLISLLWLAEIEFISRSLQLTGGGRNTNRLLAIGISGALMIVAHFAGIWIETIKQKFFRQIATIGLFSIIMGTFIALAVLRQKLFSEVVEVKLPIWVFVAINFLIFTAFYFTAIYVIIPLFGELKNTLKDILHQRKAIKLQAEIDHIKKTIKENTEKLNLQNRLRFAIISFAKTVQELIERKYKLSLSLYMEAHRSARTTHQLRVKEETPPKLDTYYNDIHI